MMKKTSMMLIVGIAFVAVALWVRQGSAQMSGPAEPIKIAVVNVAKVLSECQANLDREKQSEKLDSAIKTELADIKTQADAVKAELENVLKPGTREYNEALQKWFDLRALFESKQKGQTQILSAETQAWMETLYQKLLDQIASVARQEGITVVLDKDDAPMKPEKIQDLYNMIRTRKVLYNTPTIDLTAMVLENMDRMYEQEKAK